MTGPPLVGWMYDSQGSYQGIWFLLAGIVVLAVILVLSIRPVTNAAKLDDKV